MNKKNIETTNWLTRGMTKEQIIREKREAIMSADLDYVEEVKCIL